MAEKPHAIIIGGGFTGCAVAHDLALRGFSATLLERGELTSGTSGRTHGLLHSGGRYCVTDQESAVECIVENRILRKIAAQCIEPNGGLFMALDEKDLEYALAFEKGAQDCGIEIEKLDIASALKIEPHINPQVLAVYSVPDGTFDPLRLALAFAATARRRGVEFRAYHEVKGLRMDGQGNVNGVETWDRTSNQTYNLHGDVVINATGAWAGEIVKMAGVDTMPVIPTPGIMVAYDRRLINRALNRLCPPADGDILLPQRRMMCIGTTSFEVDDPNYIPVFGDQVQRMHECATVLVPGVKDCNMRGAWMSARPLVAFGDSGRSLARTFKCFDHQSTHGIGGLVTITGGKATTCRAMAEKTVDVVCEQLGVTTACVTADLLLDSYRSFYQ
jgi:glycerol-3-phosphate dehydrogenase